MVIFVSSIGRSGTRYLADLFSHCTDVIAQHAAEPLCHGDIMVDVYSGVRRDEVRQKARCVKAEIVSGGAYFESTQVFLRVLAEVFLEEFPSVSVIHLLRDPLGVACSYVNRQSYPSHPDRPWRMPLNLKRSLFNFPLPLTPMQENLCDWLENELLYMELEARFHRTVEFSFGDLGSAEQICRMFEELGVQYRQEDVIYHTSKQDLDRNANPRKTRVSRRHRREAESLARRLLDHGFPGEKFRRECYQPFDFVQRLLAT